MIQCFDLQLADARRPGTRLLDGASFEVPPGAWAEIVGPAGCGKSLLFAVLTLAVRPRRGSLVLLGRNLDRCEPEAYSELRQDMGFCAQRPHLLDARTAAENLLLPFVVRGRTQGARAEVDAVLTQLGLEELRDLPVARLSDQERRLVALGRAVVGKPKLILVDGGFEGLEAPRAKQVSSLLRRAQGEGSTIVLLGRERSGRALLRELELRLEQGRVAEVERSSQAPTPERGGGARRQR